MLATTATGYVRRIAAAALAALLLLCAPHLPAARAQETMPVVVDVRADAKSAHLRAIGDVMAHQKQLNRALQKDGSYNFDAQFTYVKDALSAADYTIANLELTIPGEGPFSGYPAFRTPEAILDALQGCGIDLFTMANNHILDSGYSGLCSTIDAVDRYGFDHVGVYRTAGETRQFTVADINGIRFGFLAYTEHVNGNDLYLPSDQRFCVNRLDSADFQSDVQALRDMGAEVVICMPHWGVEYQTTPASAYKAYADQMIEAGVDIILGSHPHVVQPIELRRVERDGEERDVLIAWSMGNFISNMYKAYADCGIIVDFTVTRDEEGAIHISDVGYVPVYVNKTDYSFYVVCSGDFADAPPEGMTSYNYNSMKNSIGSVARLVSNGDVAVLQN